MSHAMYFQKIIEVLGLVSSEQIELLFDRIKNSLDAGGTVFVCGNGGSGANASHFVQDLIKCPVKDFSLASGRYKVICLNDSMPTMLAYGNDLGFDQIFKQPLMNFAKPGDLVVGISGSGNSKNVVEALLYANEIGVDTGAIVGFSGGRVKEVAKTIIHIETSDMQVYEDVSGIIMHSIIKQLL